MVKLTILVLWYKCVNFGAKTSLVSPIWWGQID